MGRFVRAAACKERMGVGYSSSGYGSEILFILLEPDFRFTVIGNPGVRTCRFTVYTRGGEIFY